MQALLDRLQSCRKGTTAYQEVTVAYRENSKAGPEGMEATVDSMGSTGGPICGSTLGCVALPTGEEANPEK